MLRNAILTGIAAGIAAALWVMQAGVGPFGALLAYALAGSVALVLAAMAQANHPT